ncbi:MAG: uracil-DNA glycosylase [Planctomycetota bacterium]
MSRGWLRDRVPEAWKHALLADRLMPAWERLECRLASLRNPGGFLPPEPMVFRALEAVGPKDVRVVILGQDPYHGPGQAEGLCFSVPRPMKPPPSLRNILKELAADTGVQAPGHGSLAPWASRGVLLLNALLTVEPGEPMSHKGLGWEEITGEAFRHVAAQPGPRAFLLWGAEAARRTADLDPVRHLAVVTAHPSPLSARRGFLGSRPFSRVNGFLQSRGLPPVDWSL